MQHEYENKDDVWANDGTPVHSWFFLGDREVQVRVQQAAVRLHLS